MAQSLFKSIVNLLSGISECLVVERYFNLAGTKALVASFSSQTIHNVEERFGFPVQVNPRDK